MFDLAASACELRDCPQLALERLTVFNTPCSFRRIEMERADAVSHSEGAAFVAIAHYSGDTRKTVSFSPDTPIKEVFEAFWPQNRWGKAFAGSAHHPLPLKIEIMPDEKTVPRDERHDNPFKGDRDEGSISGTEK